jgi:hypothetical protein
MKEATCFLSHLDLKIFRSGTRSKEKQNGHDCGQPIGWEGGERRQREYNWGALYACMKR